MTFFVRTFASLTVFVLLISTNSWAVGEELQKQWAYQGKIIESMEAITTYEVLLDTGKKEKMDRVWYQETWVPENEIKKRLLSHYDTLYKLRRAYGINSERGYPQSFEYEVLMNNISHLSNRISNFIVVMKNKESYLNNSRSGLERSLFLIKQQKEFIKSELINFKKHIEILEQDTHTLEFKYMLEEAKLKVNLVVFKATQHDLGIIDLKAAVDLLIKDFSSNEENKEYTFLSSKERLQEYYYFKKSRFYRLFSKKMNLKVQNHQQEAALTALLLLRVKVSTDWFSGIHTNEDLEIVLKTIKKEMSEESETRSLAERLEEKLGKLSILTMSMMCKNFFAH